MYIQYSNFEQKKNSLAKLDFIWGVAFTSIMYIIWLFERLSWSCPLIDLSMACVRCYLLHSSLQHVSGVDQSTNLHRLMLWYGREIAMTLCPHCKKGIVIYLIFRWVNILHAWIVNPVNRFQNTLQQSPFSSKPNVYSSKSATHLCSIV